MSESDANLPEVCPEALPDCAVQQDTLLPEVTFESITFSDDTTVYVEPYDVVVLVGPNNAGKSLALRELEYHVGGNPNSKVIAGATTRGIGTKKSFEAFIRETTTVQYQPQGDGLQIQGYGVSLTMGGQDIGAMWPNSIGNFRSLFCRLIPTQSRITDSDPQNAIDVLTESASHPIHLLQDDRVEKRLSDHFRNAFGKDLILYRGGGRRSHLLVGDRLVPDGSKGENLISATYLRRLVDSCVQLEEQGDGMRSFASVILHLLAPGTPSTLLLDEPEAFLHPPQARLLGEIIVTERPNRGEQSNQTEPPSRAQLFCRHSQPRRTSRIDWCCLRTS